MSKSTWIGIALVGLAITTGAPVAGATEMPNDSIPLDATSVTVAIEIPEVECAGCSLEARKAVKGAGGVVRLGEGQPKNRLLVTYEPGPARPAVYVDALRKAGFAKAREVRD